MSYYKITLPTQRIKIIASSPLQAQEIARNLKTADFLQTKSNRLPIITPITREEFEQTA